MIYSIIIWLAVKSNKRERRVSLYQTKYNVIYVTALIIYIDILHYNRYIYIITSIIKFKLD
jgi:hypothetical protein